MNEKVGRHKGAVETLLHEQKELSRLLQIVQQQIQRHLAELEQEGIDPDQFIEDFQHREQQKQQEMQQQRQRQPQQSSQREDKGSKPRREQRSGQQRDNQRQQRSQKQRDESTRSKTREQEEDSNSRDFNPL